MKNKAEIKQQETYLSDIVQRNEYFQRSINIVYDNNDIDNLENFYCPISYEQVLIRMVNHIEQSGQMAFTWTGPYGSGKSSLALFLQALVSKNKQIINLAQAKLSAKNKSVITQYFNTQTYCWKTINIIGQAHAPEMLFREALGLDAEASTSDILHTLSSYTHKNQRLIIMIDELGKVFDGASKSSRPEDIYFLQQLAELVNRSEGNMILIGVLHQSFMAYARQASSKTHNEWLKIQGRFVDCAVTLSVDEQIHLISQVIKTHNKQLIVLRNSPYVRKQVSTVVNNIASYRKTDSDKLIQLLTNVFPLHPLVAILLCQLSKKNFGQNQRSIFSFLMSAEPNGFGYYLKNTNLDSFSMFSPSMFWDYLDSNLSNTIKASEYGKQWLLSQMAISRYEERNDEIAVYLIKTISLISIFSETTGIHASPRLLQDILDIDKVKLEKLLEKLEVASIIFYRKFSQSYMLSEGSDFNLNNAIKEQLQELVTLPFEELEQFTPVVAKAHYQLTGSFRWMEIKLLPVSNDIEKVLNSLQSSVNTSLVGYFCLLVPKNDDEVNQAIALCNRVAESDTFNNIAIAVLDSHTTIIDLLRDKIALNNILKNDDRLLNDKIARRETEGRLVEVEDALNRILNKSLAKSIWYSPRLEKKHTKLNRFKLSELASKVAKYYVKDHIICNNELVNRTKPSPSAKGAIRDLLKRMIENSEEQNLGIEKYPPQKGIYDSVLAKNGIHKADIDNNYYFDIPDDPRLQKIWKCADDIIAKSKGGLVTAKQIYEAWEAHPFGVKAGLHDILYVAYIMSRHSDLANYINEEYKPSVQYLLAEYLIKVPANVGVREVSFLEGNQTWIHTLRDRLQDDFGERLKGEIEDEPLPIAQALVSVFFSMHPWIQRTNHERLTPKAKQLRNILKQANDPNQLLFDDLPKFFNANDNDQQKVKKIIDGLQELDRLYPDLVAEMNIKLQSYLEVAEDGVNPYTEINQRAEALFGKSGDYLLDAFIARLVKYNGSMNDAESLISLLAGNKPPKKWIDQDIIKAQQKIATYGFQFLEAEVNASIDISPNRQKVGIITRSPDATKSIVREAHITSKNAESIEAKVKQLSTILLDDKKLDINGQVAVLAKLLENLDAIQKANIGDS